MDIIYSKKGGIMENSNSDLILKCPTCSGEVPTKPHNILPGVWGGQCRSCLGHRYYDVHQENGHTHIQPIDTSGEEVSKD